ncbi:MAG TPA: aminoglycoside phosphotransferase family protein [Caulobacteraceae bacterium]|nr:aminoglycoside phosphotransferase family protein [Caulobacteraceae bacterium]
MTPLPQGEVDLDVLVARIRGEFPALAFERAVLNDFGEDHAVVILDDAWVFRFPRGLEAAAYAARERRLLEHLARVSPLATPRHELISAAGDFAGYRMIAGEELSEARFAALPAPAQDTILAQIGAFLAVLHATPPQILATDGPSRPSDTGEAFAERYEERRAEFATLLPPELLVRADAFYAALPAAVAGAPIRVVHNDFTEDHILLAPEGDRLAGVIDFTDAGLGDPAFDFTFLWAYGDDAPAQVLRSYGPGHEADGILERSRWWFVRYRLDQVWWDARGHRAYGRARLLASLAHQFGALGL